ncbi:hypothetical protein Tco_1252445 [Tanacetum coccineum]
MSRIPNDGFPNLNFSQLLGTTNSNQSSSSNPSTPSSQNSIGSSSQFPSGQFPYASQYFPQMTPEQIYFQQQQAFQQAQLNTQFQNFQTQNVPETQFKLRLKLPCDKEKLLCKVWVGVFENNDIGNDRNEECFWGQIHDDFNKSTNGVSRTKNMITGKWNRMHPDCQKFHAIYKGITRKSGENDGDVLEAAKAENSACNKGKKFAYEHGWRVLKNTQNGTQRITLTRRITQRYSVQMLDLDHRVKRDPPTESSARSGSGSMKDVLNEELRQKIQAGKSAYEAKKVKEQSATKLNELQFLTIDADSLPEPKKTIIKNKQAQIMAKYQL